MGVDTEKNEKLEICNMRKDRIERPTIAEDDLQRTWKDYFEDQRNMDTEE